MVCYKLFNSSLSTPLFHTYIKKLTLHINILFKFCNCFTFNFFSKQWKVKSIYFLFVIIYSHFEQWHTDQSLHISLQCDTQWSVKKICNNQDEHKCYWASDSNLEQQLYYINVCTGHLIMMIPDSLKHQSKLRCTVIHGKRDSTINFSMDLGKCIKSIHFYQSCGKLHLSAGHWNWWFSKMTVQNTAYWSISTEVF